MQPFLTNTGATGENMTTTFIYKQIIQDTQEPYIVKKYPNRRWTNIWNNLHLSNIPTAWKTTVYCYINQIIPTEEKKYRHHLTSSPLCKKCGRLDTLKPRLTHSGDAKLIWGKANL